jgi:osmotically-inducible protein OsmY
MEEISGSRSDKDILQDIEKEFLIDEAVSTDNVNVEVINGKVVLAGTVGSLEMKQSIEDIVENINGVVLVINKIQIERI